MRKSSLILLFISGGWLAAAEPPKSESEAPKNELREMNALTLSPYTVNPGHFQIESYLVDYATSRDTRGGGNVRTDSWSFASTTFKYGVTRNLDLELEINPYTEVSTKDRVART